mgnify:CR=1 FL=1
MRSSSYEFYSLLRDCYFHPSRNKEYPCEMMKRKTKAALITLWNTEHLKILGKEYNGDKIHYAGISARLNCVGISLTLGRKIRRCSH